MLVGHQEEQPAYEKAWLSVWSEAQRICVHSSWCHSHPSSLASFKILTGLTFLMPAYPGCPGKEAFKRVSVCWGILTGPQNMIAIRYSEGPLYKPKPNFTNHNLNSNSVGIVDQYQQVLSSSWDGRPFGHNRHGPKTEGCALWRRGSWVPI